MARPRSRTRRAFPRICKNLWCTLVSAQMASTVNAPYLCIALWVVVCRYCQNVDRKTLALDVVASGSIGNDKSKIRDKESIPPNLQKLMVYSGVLWCPPRWHRPYLCIALWGSVMLLPCSNALPVLDVAHIISNISVAALSLEDSGYDTI